MEGMKRVHCTFCGQTFHADTMERCSLCQKSGGIVDPASDEALVDVVTRKRREGEQSVDVVAGLGKAAKVASLAYSVGLLSLSAVVAVGLGILLIVHPDMRGHRGGFSVADLWPGLAAVLAGIGIFGLVVYLVKKAARENSKR